MNSEAHLVHSCMLDIHAEIKFRFRKYRRMRGWHATGLNSLRNVKILTFRFQERLYNFHPSQTAKAADASYFAEVV